MKFKISSALSAFCLVVGVSASGQALGQGSEAEAQPTPKVPPISKPVQPDFEAQLDLEAQVTRAQFAAMIKVLQQRIVLYKPGREQAMIFTVQIAQIIAIGAKIYMGLPVQQQGFIDQLVPMLLGEMAAAEKSTL